MHAVRVALVLSLVVSGAAHAAPPTDGEIVESAPCRGHGEPYATYLDRHKAAIAALVAKGEAMLSAAKGGPEAANIARHIDEVQHIPAATEAEYQRLFGSGTYACTRVVYGSDGLRVVGYVLRKSVQAPGAPILLFLRGGNRDLGKVDERLLAGRLLPFADAGYVVVAPQYRGVDGGEGQEEFGGADVHDVLAMAGLARGLPNVAPDDLFVFGASRGGMMTYLALAQGLPARAAAVLGGPTDLALLLKERPEMEQVCRELIPRYATNRNAALRARSALYQVDKLNVPLLLLHGSADWRVGPENALRMALKLDEAKKPYGLLLFPGGDHGLSAFADEAQRTMLAWFAEIRAPRLAPNPGSPPPAPAPDAPATLR